MELMQSSKQAVVEKEEIITSTSKSLVGLHAVHLEGKGKLRVG